MFCNLTINQKLSLLPTASAYPVADLLGEPSAEGFLIQFHWAVSKIGKHLAKNASLNDSNPLSFNKNELAHQVMALIHLGGF